MIKHWNRCYGWESDSPWFDDFKTNKPIRKFEAFFFFVGWWSLSLGIHISIINPNMEVHLPFGFIRVGWCRWTISKDGKEISN